MPPCTAIHRQTQKFDHPRHIQGCPTRYSTTLYTPGASAPSCTNIQHRGEIKTQDSAAKLACLQNRRRAKESIISHHFPAHILSAHVSHPGSELMMSQRSRFMAQSGPMSRSLVALSTRPAATAMVTTIYTRRWLRPEFLATLLQQMSSSNSTQQPRRQRFQSSADSQMAISFRGK